MSGDAMALVLLCSITEHPHSVRGLARLAWVARETGHFGALPEELPSPNQLRPLERAVNRCRDRSLLDDTLRPTPQGIMELARSERGLTWARTTGFHEKAFSMAPLSLRIAYRDLAALAMSGDESARTSVAFLYWHGLLLATISHRASAEASLGGKVVSDARQTSLPLDMLPSAGADRANTGALPQPPYNRELTRIGYPRQETAHAKPR